MSNLKTVLKTIIFTLLILSVSGQVFAADIAKGQGLARRVCAACHGKQGISRAPVFPNLSGQKQAYLFKQLKDFKAGVRSSNNMQGVTASLSEEDMSNVAAYFAAHGNVEASAKKVSQSLLKKVDDKLNICMPCHTRSGISQNDKFPNLAGQKDRYLQKELEKFKKGKRKDATMSAIVKQLDKKDIKNLSKYFSRAGKIKIQ